MSLAKLLATALALYLGLAGFNGLGAQDISSASAVTAVPPELVDILMVPVAVQSLKARLTGRTSTSIQGVKQLQDSAKYMAYMMSDLPGDCPGDVTLAGEGRFDRYVFVLPVLRPYDVDVEKVMEYVESFVQGTLGPGDDRGGVKAYLVAQLGAHKFGKLDIKFTAVNPNLRITISLVDAEALAGSDFRDVADFAVFFGLAGLKLDDAPDLVTSFSYLYGGGEIASLAGSGDERFGRMCVAMPIIRAVCDGSITGHESADRIATVLSAALSECEQPSQKIKALKQVDQLLQR